MSMMLNAMVQLRWSHTDPELARREVWSAVGDLSGVRLIGSQVLLASYMRPVRFGGVYTTNAAQSEDIFQGVVGMIVKIGPQAWRETTRRMERPDAGREDVEIVERGDEARFGGDLPQLGEWVYCRPQDTVMCAIRGPGSKMELGEDGKRLRDFEGWPCKLVYARDIYLRLTEPHIIV